MCKSGNPLDGADDFSSPACSMHEVSDVYMGYADRIELAAFLDELLESSRAAAQIALEGARVAETGRLYEQFRAIEENETRWGGVLLLHVGKLAGEPTSAVRQTYGEAMASADLGERIAFPNSRQGWIAKKSRGMLPRLRDGVLRSDLADMLRSRERGCA